MKKSILILIIIISFPLAMISEEEKADGFFFYVPNQDQINDYFSMFKYLINWDLNKTSVDEKALAELYDNYVGKETLQSLLFESFLRQTKNKNIQKRVLKYIDNNGIKNEYSQSLIRLYNSKEKKYKQDNNEQIQYNYNEEYFDENINLFYQSESFVFNKELGLMLFENPWANISFKSNDNKNKNFDSFFLMYGGGTNSMTIHFNKYIEISFEDFKKNEINKYNSERYKNWKIVELKKEGILINSGADKVFIGFGIGPDIIPEIDTGTFNIYLYNEKLKKGYTISYFMNFSKINNNYNLRVRIWNHLLMQLCLSFINIS